MLSLTDPGFAAAVLEVLPDATAILDQSGRIIAVNRVWRMFALDNGGDLAKTGIGVSYIEVCERSIRNGCSDAAEVLERLRAVLAGQTVEGEWEYPCPSPVAGRWFALRITRISGPAGGAVVSHVNITRRKMSEEELAHRASHDPLTGLANRLLFAERVTQALCGRPGRDDSRDVGLVYIDLDDFKPVNDAYGHAAGDEVLLVTASRLRSLVRRQDTVARLGGDEFAVCAPRITEGHSHRLARDIESALAAPIQVHGQELRISASTGTVLVGPGTSLEEALDAADRAMYAVKNERHAKREIASVG